MFRANKKLGQHFLLNPTTLDKILNLADISKDDRVLEIGPGPGALTERLAQRAGQVIAVEKDSRFAAHLRKKLKPYENITILEGDFLELDIKKIVSEYRTDRALPVRPNGANDAINGFQMGGSGGERLSPPGSKWKVVANLPYNIATEILFRLLDSPSFFHSLYLMVQKEVATRIVAKPGSKDYGILSVLTQLFSENRIVFKLKPGSFTPPPKVDSAVVEFKISEACRFPIHHRPTFEAVVRAAFGQRRKTIANALKGGGFEGNKISEALQEVDIPAQARAETVAIEKFVHLANVFSPDRMDAGVGNHE